MKGSISIGFKLWAGIIVMTILILLFSMFFQTLYLNDFYQDQEMKLRVKDCQILAQNVITTKFSYEIDFKKYIKTVNDIIIITDKDNVIRNVIGTNEYKKNYLFGSRFVDSLRIGKIVTEKNKIIKNSDPVRPKNLETLLVGVPLFSESQDGQIDFDKNKTVGVVRNTTKEYTGAVFLISPVDQLGSTTTAIQKQFLYIFIVSLIIASLLSLLLANNFTKPLVEITKAVSEIAKGNYSYEIQLSNSKEIKNLGNTMNNLAKQLSRVEHIRKEFIANVSHELRTPLSYLQGYTEILLDDLVDTEEERKKYLSIIKDETDRLKLMVDEILSLSQMEEGSIALKLTKFSVEAVVKRTIDKLLPNASKRSINIKYNQLSEDALFCIADENKIKQVLINLLHNAIRHSFDYSNILISAYRISDNIYICVRDFGEGIPENDLPFIWDRFYTADKKKNGDHVGLGLAIVKNIINAHGCEVSVNSIVGEGTEFCFNLPSLIEDENWLEGIKIED